MKNSSPDFCIREVPGALVIDDVLSQEEFVALRLYLQFQTYKPVHQQEWMKAWRLTDGAPFSNTAIARQFDHDDFVPQVGIDLLMQRIIALRNRINDFLGESNKIDFFTATAFLYPVNSGLGWHEDNEGYQGAYIFYAHPVWKPNWGGELCICDDEMPKDSVWPEEINDCPPEVFKLAGITGGCIGPEFGWTHRERTLEKNGIGTFIYPKPNRLVIIKPHFSHCIKKVDVSAGENVRCSIAGFFQKNP